MEEPRGTPLSERGQAEKARYCMIPARRHSEKGKTKEPVKHSAAARDEGDGGCAGASIFRAAKSLRTAL